jgi:hypothetical protein
MTGKAKGASEGKKKPKYTVKAPQVKTPKVKMIDKPCKKCGESYNDCQC